MFARLSCKYFTVSASRKMSTIRLPPCLEKIRPSTVPELDYSTNSNHTQFEVKHTSLDFEILFDKKILNGFVKYELRLKAAGGKIVLDSTNIDISKVSLNQSNVSFSHDTSTKLGHALIIPGSFEQDQHIDLQIFFKTTDKTTALQFLNKDQTDGKKHQYLFSQSEPIHSRTIFPCFDTPSVKSPYSVVVKSPYKTLVSALIDQEKQASAESGVYYFRQPVPIPSYLFAIVSGDITSARIGPRSLIYTEPVNIKRCANEFKNEVVEKFLEILEKLIYKYEWTDYDFVIAPMAFPYGGMENPQLTLANSTIVSGDAENIDVIAHELAHSYSGNLVTNASWEHFWLNEGWTVYLERRILAGLHGESYRHFSAIIGWNDLEESVSRMDLKYTKLVQNLKDGSDPDDAFSTVPYEKGFNFLFHLETRVGGTKNFDPFVRHYFTKFNKKSVDTYQFIETLFEFYANNDPENYKKLLEVDYETWLLKTGLPPKPKFDTTLVNQAIALSEQWYGFIRDSLDDLSEADLANNFSNSDVAKYSSNQLVVFLDHVSVLNDKKPTLNSKKGHTALKFIGKEYKRIADNNNAEVKFRWFKLQLKGQLTQVYQPFADWLGTVGRMKFVRPGYILLNEGDRDLAIATFRKFQNSYHPICVAMVKKDINLE